MSRRHSDEGPVTCCRGLLYCIKISAEAPGVDHTIGDGGSLLSNIPTSTMVPVPAEERLKTYLDKRPAVGLDEEVVGYSIFTHQVEAPWGEPVPVAYGVPTPSPVQSRTCQKARTGKFMQPASRLGRVDGRDRLDCRYRSNRKSLSCLG